MATRLVLAGASLGLIFLVALGSRQAASRIEQELETSAERRLEEAGATDVVAVFDGREAVLTGTAPTAGARSTAERAVAELEGLRGLENRITVGRARRDGAAPAVPSSSPNTVADRGSDSAARASAADRDPPSEPDPSSVVAAAPDTARTDDARSSRNNDPAPEPPASSEPDDDRQEKAVTAPLEPLESPTPEPAPPAAARSVRSRPAADRQPSRLPAAAVETQRAIDRVLRRRVIEFQVSSDRLTPGGRSALEALLEPLSEAAGHRIEISGHTDGRGPAASNLDLSERRARRVLEFLVDGGIPRSQLEAVGRGETRPIADNDTPEGRRKNRRIELKVIGVTDE